MRIQTLLLWTFAMLCGTVLMFVAGLVWFPLESTKIARDVPQSQVLVAKQDIPTGTRIHAEFVEYRFVPVRSIPVGATTDFHRIYNRKTIYPIPEGTPICDMDLDTPMSEKANEQFRVPFGMNVVRIQVERIQTDAPVGDEITAEVLSQAVHPGDTVDLMLLETAQKVELPANRSPFGFTNRNRSDSGTKDTVYHRKPTQLIASGLKVYAFNEKAARESNPVSRDETATSAAPQPVISLLMSKDQLDEVKKAAKLGRLQIVLHSPNAVETGSENANEEETNLPQSSSRARLIVQASATQTQSRSSNIRTANYYVTEVTDETQAETEDAFDEVPVESFVEPVNDEPAENEPAEEEPVEEPLPEIAPEPTEPVEEPAEEESLPEIVADEPITEPENEPILETPESIVEPVEEPIVEIVDEPVLEIASEPTEEPTVEPTEEPTVEPTVEPIAGPTLAPPFPKAVVSTATEPTLAPPLPKIAEQVSEPIVKENVQDQKNLTLSVPESPEKPTISKTNRSGKQQPVVKIGLTPLKRRQARLDRTYQTPPQTVKSTVKPDQVPPNDYITREYDPDNTPETSQEVVRIVSFARNKKIDLYPHYFYEPTSVLLSPDRMAIQEQRQRR